MTCVAVYGRSMSRVKPGCVGRLIMPTIQCKDEEVLDWLRHRNPVCEEKCLMMVPICSQGAWRLLIGEVHKDGVDA